MSKTLFMNKRAVTEIGSEFWSVPQSAQATGLFPRHTMWFQSGRTALAYILKDILSQETPQSALLPSWCCESMIRPFLEQGIHVTFYPVYRQRDGRLMQDLRGQAADITLVMEYFGYHSVTLGEPTGLVIRDITHSLLTEYLRPTIDEHATYYFGSLRKWCGVYTGGFAWTTHGSLAAGDIPTVDETYVALRREAMARKQRYMQALTEDRSFLTMFAQAEEHLESCGIGAADPRDVEAAMHLDISSIIRNRRRNATVLLDYVSSMALFPTLREEECPLFVPIMVPNGQRDALRACLIEQKIYCPVHWPLSPYHRVTDEEAAIYRDVISLVCDQRYTEEDMIRTGEQIRKFMA